ncbi:hypothetical protein D3C71_1690990 [compost metagenome]
MARGRGDVTFEVELEIRGLGEGDVIEISNGGIIQHHEVIRVKRVNIETKYNGGIYNIPFILYKKTIKKIDPMEALKKLNENREEYKTLKPGEPFFFKANNGKDAILLYFMHLEPGRIVGKSPVGDRTWRIDETMYGGKIQMPVFTR